MTIEKGHNKDYKILKVENECVKRLVATFYNLEEAKDFIAYKQTITDTTYILSDEKGAEL